MRKDICKSEESKRNNRQKHFLCVEMRKEGVLSDNFPRGNAATVFTALLKTTQTIQSTILQTASWLVDHEDLV